jgi:hypothetical protein
MKDEYYEKYFNIQQFFAQFVITSYENISDDEVLEELLEDFNGITDLADLKEIVEDLKENLLLIIEHKEKYINDIMLWANRYFNSSEELGVWLTMIYNKIDEKYKNLET